MVVCRGLHFALQAEIVKGIVAADETNIQQRLASFGGDASSVSELGELFGWPPGTPSPESRIFVCGTPQVSRAFQVDRLLGLQDVDAEQFRPFPRHFRGPEREWFGGFILIEETLALIINSRWLVGAMQGESQRSLSGGISRTPAEPELIAPAASEIVLEEATDAEELPWAEL